MDQQELKDFKAITALSVRCCEVILYPPLATLENVLPILRTKSIKEFAMILHDKDEKKPHIHLLMWFYTPTPTSSVLGWFSALGVTMSNLGKIKSRKGALAYLTHANRPEKYQYPIEDVVRSDGLKEELSSATKDALRKEEIKNLCDSVALGLTSPRSLLDNLNGIELRDNQKLIDASINARLTKSSILKERNMEVIYIYGPAGSGKSTLARFLAVKHTEETPYISSSSNDPLQDYMLEPAMILDDLRGDSFKFADLLKLLDNHVPSSVKCRYRNKTIDAKYCFITSTRSVSELYNADTFTKDDNLDQLKRRIGQVYFIRDDGNVFGSVYEWDEKHSCFIERRDPQPICNMSQIFSYMKIARLAKDQIKEARDFIQNVLAEDNKNISKDLQDSSKEYIEAQSAILDRIAPDYFIPSGSDDHKGDK